MTTPDEELMQRVQKRDASAFEVLLQRHERAVGRSAKIWDVTANTAAPLTGGKIVCQTWHTYRVH